MIFPSAG